jgi:glyoxylase-like metal-dependent hydrolase (beta-lactamase superfamily II)
MDNRRCRQKLAAQLMRSAGEWLASIFCLFLVLLPTVSTTGLAQTHNPAPDKEPLRPEWCQQLPRPEYKSLKRVNPNENWFEVYEIRDGVYAIYEPHQFEEVISYLIVGNRRALLFDTGMGIGKISDAVRHLTHLPVTVLNSHTHFDHVGGNAEFADILGRDTPFTHNNEKGQSNEYSKDALAPERICGQLPAGMNDRVFSVRPFHISSFVHDNQEIDLGGRTLTVLFTPGHTPDEVSLFDRDNALLFTGDTFYPGPIYLFTPETDFAAYKQSVARLVALMPQVKTLLPGHNVPVADPANLTRLSDAVRQVESGNVKPVVSEGHREYKFQGFSLVLSAH